MTDRLFGTDGVRGVANAGPLTPEGAVRLAQAAGLELRRDGRRPSVAIGKDTRLSGYMLETAMTAGFASVGVDTLLLGPVPTPAVGMLTRSLRAGLGVMISASHNPFEDNGVKFFGPDGYKLSDAEESAIERRFARGATLSEPAQVGWSVRVDGATERYVEFAKASFPRSLRLDGLKIALDCANGAAWRAAPRVFWELGAEVVEIGCAPDGLNINAGCGSTDVDACRKAVLETGADIGVALDGDADRVHLIDETGRVVDGDQLIALIAARQAAEGRLSGGAVVATVMSNLGLERHLADLGLGLHRTKVGDRYVIEEMRARGCSIGGEQSGHVILADHATTGDGVIAGLQALAELAREGRPASEILKVFEPVPQTMRSVRVADRDVSLGSTAAQRAVAAARARLGGDGRLVVRPSGTEPVIRVMIEGEDRGLIESLAVEIEEALLRSTPPSQAAWADEMAAYAS